MTRQALLAATAGGFFALAATGWCAWMTGAGLPLFFGAVLLAAIYVPAVTVAEEGPQRWISPLAASAMICICWAVSCAFTDVTAAELLRCVLICLTFVMALSGSASLLARLGIGRAPAAGLVTLLALLWLTWPAWLSHALTQSRVNALTACHPLLAINGVLRHLGAWDRATLAYQRLTVLNQDIPYSLPRSIIPAVVLHGMIAGTDLAVCHLVRKKRDSGLA